MSSRSTSSSSSIVTTDSYPSLYKSFSSKQSSASSSSSLSTSSSRTSSSTGPTPSQTPSKVLNIPERETTPSTVPPRLKWDREAPAAHRPYDFRNYEIPFKSLQPYLSQLGGLGVPPPKPCHPPKPDPFHKRTHIDEIFHKRVTDFSVFSISEQPKAKEICHKEDVLRMGEIAQKAVNSVILADNVDSEGSGSSKDSSSEDDLSEISWNTHQQKPVRDGTLRECKRSFFQARKELFKLRQYDDYLKEKDRKPEEAESWEISSESTLESLEEEDFLEEQVRAVREDSESNDTYHSTEIVHEEDKLRSKEHKKAYMNRIREHMWSQFRTEEEQQRMLEAERDISPEPQEEDEIAKSAPKQDFLNLKKHEFRQQLADRLEQINSSINREPKKLPQTAVQFEKYTDELISRRRELRDEAVLVDEHYKKAGIDMHVPEKDLQLKKFRASDVRSEATDVFEENETTGELSEQKEEPRVHTCMTRLEWARWIGRSTKIEKLKLPKVKIPRIPRAVHVTEQSPIRMYIRGLQRDDKQPGKDQESKQGDSADAEKLQGIETKTVKWHLQDVLYDKPKEYRISKFVPYKAPIRPFPELAKDRFRASREVRRRRRDRLRQHMAWIDQLVEEICERKYELFED